jgi:hypothetical protein
VLLLGNSTYIIFYASYLFYCPKAYNSSGNSISVIEYHEIIIIIIIIVVVVVVVIPKPNIFTETHT